MPDEADFWRPPARFGSIPVEKEPMGWDRRLGFRKLFPRISLPFQVVERVRFGHPDMNPNRLFCGDNLPAMRSLPAESLDLIYCDPPFFSQREYSLVASGERRSFSDIWKEGLDGYLQWLNPRLAECRRLLKKTGSLYLHCNPYANYCLRLLMNSVFGEECFRNEIIWSYRTGGVSKRWFARKHDTIFCYGKTPQDKRTQAIPSFKTKFNAIEEKSYLTHKYGFSTIKIEEDEGGYYRMAQMRDVWEIPALRGNQPEAQGYPTQKPEALLERIILASSDEGDVVGDFPWPCRILRWRIGASMKRRLCPRCRLRRFGRLC